MSELVGVRFTIEKVREIEEWRRLQPVIPSRTDAIRELVNAGLDAYKGKLPKKAKPQ